MAYRLQASFAKGELDPALQERVTLDAYDSGLNTGRNVVVGKTGRILSRPGRKLVRAVETGMLNDKKIILKALNDGYFAEIGIGELVGPFYRVRIREQDYDSIVNTDVYGSNLSNNNLESISLVIDGEEESNNIKSYSVAGRNVFLNRIRGSTSFVFESANDFSSVALDSSTAGGTGYDVEYMATVMIDGVERFYSQTVSPSPISLPGSGEENELVYKWDTTDHYEGLIPDEMRFYRRPKDGGAWGFLGSVNESSGSSGTVYEYTFIDYGQDADFANQPPKLIIDNLSNFEGEVETIGSHQGRLIACKGNELFTSTSGELTLALREFPFNSSSAISTRVGEKGETKILWVISRDDLIVFTTNGIYVNRGVLSFQNLAFTKTGDWVCDQDVPPILVPGGLLFVDASTNTVRQFAYSDDVNSYIAQEVSIFSDHLFRENKITSWAFQGGDTPYLYVTFSNGDGALFTYEADQQMRAWTRVDSIANIEYVASLRIPETDSEPPRTDIIFITNYDGDRYIERSVRRTPTVNQLADNPEADKGETIAAMDSMVSWSEMLNDDLTDDDMTLTPVTAGEWDGNLTLAVTDDAIFPDPGAGEVGTVFRHFHPVDKTEVDLEIVSRTNDNEVVVEPSAEFPSDYATNPRLYKTKNTFDGLDHLEGESVAIVADGYVLASPNNNIEDYPTVTVSSGEIDLPDDYLGAIVHIGLPYTMDIETLDVHTVEQRPTYIESVTVNKLYVKVFNSRGLYIGNRFPDDDKVEGTDENAVNMVEMEGLDSYDVNYEDEDPIIGNRYQQPETKRHEIILPGDWKSNGRVCIRQVDPIHFEILSIIPDVDDQGR